ncbi:MAG: outer membrane lipoprotein carrier protein LolA [Ignavibacteriaceae bacterium]|nr:outer membrane lipoprotein carrier protein LolA [Ignavibacteriaceae bacterium]
MKLLALSIIITLAINFHSFSQNGANIDAIQKKFNSLTDIYAVFTQYSNGKEQLSGKFYYKKFDKMRVESTNLLIISDGQTNWNYNEKEKRVVITSFDPEDVSILSLNKLVNDIPPSCNITKGENGSFILTPKKPGTMNFSKVELTANSDKLLTNVKITGNDGTLFTIDFTKIQTNQKLSDDFFKFTVKGETKVVDLR